MRTIIENREDLSTKYTKSEGTFYYSDKKWTASKSCFYNFGEMPEAKFVAAPDEKECQYIQKFIDEFLKRKA